MEKVAIDKSFVKESVKGAFVAFLFSTVFVLILALIAKLFNVSDKLLPIINQVLKVISVFVATLLCVKKGKPLLKAVFLAVLYSVISLIVFFILGGEFAFGSFALDFGLSIVFAGLASIIVAKKS
ncbi:MAG: TIGR04086 family membrane protein [Clostridia bacterium]